jgi:hypothetical protein
MQIRLLLVICLGAISIAALAQAMSKPGLWEMTSTLTWQKTPMPPGVTLPPGMANPFAPSTRTTAVCMTQEMIDKFGAPFAYSQGQENCTVANIVRKPTGLTAEMTCSGVINGHETIASSWPDGNTAHGTAHFAGTMQMGASTAPVEYTVESTSTYKSADCGSVKPLPLPASK